MKGCNGAGCTGGLGTVGSFLRGPALLCLCPWGAGSRGPGLPRLTHTGLLHGSQHSRSPQQMQNPRIPWDVRVWDGIRVLGKYQSSMRTKTKMKPEPWCPAHRPWRRPPASGRGATHGAPVLLLRQVVALEGEKEMEAWAWLAWWVSYPFPWVPDQSIIP